jgi:hypothetical protein
VRSLMAVVAGVAAQQPQPWTLTLFGSGAHLVIVTSPGAAVGLALPVGPACGVGRTSPARLGVVSITRCAPEPIYEITNTVAVARKLLARCFHVLTQVQATATTPTHHGDGQPAGCARGSACACNTAV